MSNHPLPSKPARASRLPTIADPFREVDNQFWALFARPAGALPPVPAIKLDVSENDDAYQIKADLPGVKKEDIKVRIEGNYVSIGAEIRQEEESKSATRLLSSERSSSQYRAFTLPHEIDGDKAEAKYVDGVLELTLPKKPGGKTSDVEVK